MSTSQISRARRASGVGGTSASQHLLGQLLVMLCSSRHCARVFCVFLIYFSEQLCEVGPIIPFTDGETGAQRG